ncbi:hypothetical protein AGMMS49587_17630 [Spirochaetia bacterium]|nr:hypothetical protein AGMMS49587_17630 [Spirochaetia bacterium]
MVVTWGGDTFRGKFGRNDGWNAGINSWLTAEDDIFWRFAARGTFAVHFKFEFEQLQGLSVQAAFPSSGADGASGTGVDGNNTSKIAHVFGGSQVAVGYTIPNIGLARFQFIGGRYAGKIDKSSYVLLQDSDVAPGAWAAGQTAGNISSSPKPGYGYDVSYLDGSKDYAQIQFAFNLLAVEGLGADLGFTYPLPLTVDELHAGTIPITGVNTPAAGITLAKDDVYQAPIGIHLGGKYTLSSGDFAVNYRISTRFAEKEKYAAAGSFDKKYGAQFFLGLQPTYKLGEIGTVGLDFSLTTKGSDSQDVTDFRNGANSIGVGLFFSRPIANGAFTIGFLSKFAAGGDAYKVFTAGPGSSPARTQLQVDNAKKKATSISIPIMWEYSL